MIQKTGDYYTFDQGPSKQLNPSDTNLRATMTRQQSHQAVGNVKQKIQTIRQRFLQLKQQKQQLMKKQQLKSPHSIFQKIKPSTPQPSHQTDIQLYIPSQLLSLDQKLSLIQQKLKPNQLIRRKLQSKGTLVQRIRLLHQRLKTILQKSSQIIVNNIQNYCASLDDKEEYLKVLFLREAHTKVKGILFGQQNVGMKEEILVLEMYLQNLNHVHTKLKAVEPVEKTIEKHGEILKLRQELSQKIRQLFDKMKKTYGELLEEMEKV